MPRTKDPISPKSLSDNVGKNPSYWRRMKEKGEFWGIVYKALKEFLKSNLQYMNIKIGESYSKAIIKQNQDETTIANISLNLNKIIR